MTRLGRAWPALAAIALALVAALVGTAAAGPTATTSAPAKKTLKKAKKALKKAKKANKKAKKAQGSANEAQSSAQQAQGLATSAQTAADEALARQASFSFGADAPSAPSNVFQGGGLRLEASCEFGGIGGPQVLLEARSLADDSIIHRATIDPSLTPDYASDSDFDNNTAVALNPGKTEVEGTFTFRNGQNGTIATSTYLTEENYGAFDCAAYGTVTIP